MSNSSFLYVTYIASTPERVWAALTDGKLSREYWGGRQVESDWKPGSPVRFRKLSGEHDMVRATVAEAAPPDRLIMLWTYELTPGAEMPPPQRLTYTIEAAAPENAKLTVLHEGVEGNPIDDALRNGWPAILSSLKSYLETGTALAVTRQWAREGK
jgi:uncharacterized protein YndB with AHSA1/START domain